MKVRPLEDYWLMGTEFKLDSTKVYDATHATNLPDWEAKGKIFVHLDVEDLDGVAIVLEKGEYEIVG
jgi:hypothetical protein